MGDATRRAEIGRLMTFTANGIIKTNPSFQIIERPTCNKDARWVFTCRIAKHLAKLYVYL